MNWLTHHQFIDGMLAIWLFSGLVSTMPPLDPTAGYWTRWLYGFLHFVAANWDKFKTSIQTPLK